MIVPCGPSRHPAQGWYSRIPLVRASLALTPSFARPMASPIAPPIRPPAEAVAEVYPLLCHEPESLPARILCGQGRRIEAGALQDTEGFFRAGWRRHGTQPQGLL